MLSFFRRLINSRIGIVITLVSLGVIAFSFTAGGSGALRSDATGAGGAEIAEVGGKSITADELIERVRNEMEAARQQDPGLDMARFVLGGGVEGTLDRMINGLAVEKFAERHGMRASDKLIDGRIASIPAFQGATGQFDEATYRSLLEQRKIPEAQLRGDIARETLAQQLMGPLSPQLLLQNGGDTMAPQQLALPYASLLLERRQGHIALIPTRAIGMPKPPADAEIVAYYRRNIARFTVPERRSVRYAVVEPSRFDAASAPSDAEIQARYARDSAKYAAREQRSFTQVVLATQSAATALAARVKGGTPIAAAAAAAGLSPSTIVDVAQDAMAQRTSPEVARAGFAAKQGDVLGPLRSPLGWNVLRVDAVTQIAGKSLAQVRGEIATTLRGEKRAAALIALHDRIDDQTGESATFDEVVRENRLQAEQTAPVIASGIDPGAPAGAKPDQRLAALAKAAFGMEEGDAPQLVQLGVDGTFAVVGIGSVVPAAPRPLAQIKPLVATQLAIESAQRQARKVAAGVVAKVNGGMPLADALRGTGLALPPVEPMGGSRAEFAARQERVPPPMALMFAMPLNRAKLLEAPKRAGWFVVYLDSVQRGDARSDPAIVTRTRAELGRLTGSEYIQQFTEAVQREVGVERNAAALAAIKRQLSGGNQP